MHLERPLFFFDLETTGLDTERDRVIEIAGIKAFPDKTQERFESFVNPERPIPPEVTKLTGINDQMVADAPTFRELVPALQKLMRDADLAGYNVVNFDIPMLESEFKRCSVPLPGPDNRAVIDPLEILKKHEVRTLSWAHKFYLGEEPGEGHRSMEDTETTLKILRAQIKQYGLSGTVSEIQQEIRFPYLDGGRRLKQEGDKILINFGKYRGKALSYIKQIDPDYLSWMRENLGMEVAKILRRV
ncbi:MAG: exonuclease domain-containing protein [Rhodothermales bacterium]